MDSDAQKQMVEFGCGTCAQRFHDLQFFHIPWIHYLLEDIITKLCRKPLI